MVRKSNNSALNSLVSRLNSVFLDNKIEKEITFAAASTGAVATHKIVDVTGTVAMQIFAVCGTNLAGATATIEVGTALSTAGLIAQTVGTNITAGEIWHDATPDASIELTSVVGQKIVTQNVAYKVASAALSAGKLKFIVLWTPLTEDGSVTLA